jgi:hypothetical protein
VYLFDSEAAGNFTLNLRGNVATSLNNVLASVGESISVTAIVRMGASAYSITAINIDGTLQSVNWVNTSAALTASKLNIISIVALKTATDTYTVIGSVTVAGLLA